MEKLNSNKKIYGILIITIISVGIFATIEYQNKMGQLFNYDPSEDQFWGLIPEDVMIYAIYNEMKSNNPNIDLHELLNILLKVEVLANDDLGIDSDPFPDLLFSSNYLIGNEELGIKIPQINDINIFYFLLLSIIKIILTTMNADDPEALEQTMLMIDSIFPHHVLPSVSSLHSVSSSTISFLSTYYNSFRDNSLLGVPTYSFESAINGTDYENLVLPTMIEGEGDRISVQYMPEERNWSKGLLFEKITEDETPVAILSPRIATSNNSGSFGFWVFIEENMPTLIGSKVAWIENPLLSDGIVFQVNESGITKLEGDKNWTLAGEDWYFLDNDKAGEWTQIADENDLSLGWNFISFDYENDYKENVSLFINGNNISNFTYTLYSDFDYLMDTFVLGTTESGSIYIDDIYDKQRVNKVGDEAIEVDNIATSFIKSFLYADQPLSELIRTASIYNLLFLPMPMDFDALIEFFFISINSVFNELASLSGVVESDAMIQTASYIRSILEPIFQLSSNELRITIGNRQFLEIAYLTSQTFAGLELETDYTLEELEETEDDVLGEMWLSILNDLNLPFPYFGVADFEFSVCWDRNIYALNHTYLKFRSTELDTVNEYGFKLITTRSPLIFKDGYSYYNDTWYSYENNFVKLDYPFSRSISQLHEDSYPDKIPNEYNLFDLDKLTEPFINEFDYSEIMIESIKENILPISLISLGFIGISSGASFGIASLVQFIQKRKK